MLEFLIPAGASLISGLIGADSQRDTNRTNVNLGREQMAFQKEMSNTSYQRAVGDMKAAGLNPMLAYSQGGASAPMGSMPQVQNAVTAGMSSAQQSMATMAGITQMMQTQAGTDKLKAEAEKVRSETMEKDLNSARAWSELEKLHQDTRKSWAEGGKAEVDAQTAEVLKKMRELELARDSTTFSADVARRKAESELTQLEIPRSKAEAEFYKGLGEFNPMVRMLIEILRGGASARQIFRR